MPIAKAGDTDAIGHLMATVPSFFTQELEPHFRDEETTLLPRLAAAGAHALVRRRWKSITGCAGWPHVLRPAMPQV